MKARFLLATLVLSALNARAELAVSLSAAVQNSARGREIVFSGTLTNTSANAKLYLNEIASALEPGSGAALVFSRNSFFANVPGVLLPNESYSESELFRVSLPADAPAGDYRATVTFQGGADIFADDALASGSYAVLSPAVDVAVSVGEGSEFGPQAAVFSISRSGGTEIALPVAFTLGGTALNGADYLFVATPVSIPAGAQAVTVRIRPIPNNLAQGDRSVHLALAPTDAGNPGLTSSGSVIIHDKPVDAWRVSFFGAEANSPPAADAASWSGDGIANLLKFALGLDPTRAQNTALPVAQRMGDYLALAFVPNPQATDVALVVEGSPDLQAWDAARAEQVPFANPLNQLVYRYRFPVTEVPRGFLRLRAERIEPATVRISSGKREPLHYLLRSSRD